MLRKDWGIEKDRIPIFAFFGTGCASAFVVEARRGRVEAAVIATPGFVFRVFAAFLGFVAFLGAMASNKRNNKCCSLRVE